MTVDRSNTILQHEGNLLQIAANHSKQDAAEHARGVIDGTFNGLLRIEDTEEVVKFAFALADRIAGKVRAPTAWPLPQAAPVNPPTFVEVLPPPKQPRRFGFWTIFAIGYGCAAVHAAFVIAALMAGGAR